MHERKVVHELYRHPAGRPDLGAGPGRLGRQDGQGGPDPLAPAGWGRRPVGLCPAQVVAHHSRDVGRQTSDGVAHKWLSQIACPFEHFYN